MLTIAVLRASAVPAVCLAFSIGAIAAEGEAAASARQWSAHDRSLARSGGEVLDEGEREIEPAFAYESSRGDDAYRRREWSVALRAGLPGATQIELVLPYARESFDGETIKGTGDVQLELAKQFDTPENAPELIGSIALRRSGRTGQGHDSIDAALTAVKSLETVDVVASLGYSFGRSRATLGSLSVHWDATPTVAMRAGVAGTRRALVGELGVSISLSERLILDVTAGRGLTREAPDYTFGVSLPFRF